MINQFQVENLRSLTRTPWVTIKPITLLVGNNSSGKSTFLRSLALLQQSIFAQTKGPILWYGQSVDFGTLKESLRYTIKENEPARIGFGFKIGKKSQRTTYGLRLRPEIFAKLYVRESKTGDTETDLIQLEIAGSSIQINFDTKEQLRSVAIDSEQVDITNEYLPNFKMGNLFPRLPRNNLPFRRYYSNREHYFYYNHSKLSNRNPLEQPLLAEIRSIVHRNTLDFTVFEIAEKITIDGDKPFKDQLLSLKSVPSSWTKGIKKLRTDSKKIKSLKRAWLLYNLGEILADVESEVTLFLRTIRYIKPVRASAERYYRKQGLAVDEIDPEGSNTAMFLDSLTRAEKRRFNEWCDDLLGLKFEAEKTGGHVALKIGQQSSNETLNLADVGFGYSQLLPIIVQLWNSKYKKSRTKNSGMPRGDLILIEQPELHLHPKLQAKLANIFSKAIQSKERKDERKLSLMVETHSEYLINTLGRMIYDGLLRSSDVQIVVFEGNDLFEDCKVRISTFNKQGELKNWPIGFFST